MIELRPLVVADAAAHKAGEDEEQLRAFEFPGPAPMENVIAAIEQWQDSWRNGGPVRNFGVWDCETGALVGNVELRVIEAGRVNLSYLVFPEWRRRGIATQAARLALDYATCELGATVATIKVLRTNTASLGVARVLGAVHVGDEPSEHGNTFDLFELVLPV